MQVPFLGQIPFSHALLLQQQAWQAKTPTLIAFECPRTITLGRRSTPSDLLLQRSLLEQKGYHVVAVDRGGQATLHNPGQLVIFPIWPVTQGVKQWVRLLADCTIETLAHFGCSAFWQEERPGLYTDEGKIMSLGVRVRQGFSTHGLAINVQNDLSDFLTIRPCGISQAPMAKLGGTHQVPLVFEVWAKNFQQLTRTSFRSNLKAQIDSLRL